MLYGDLLLVLMSILPRFPPFKKFKGRDYNLIADQVESFLALAPTSGDTSSTTTPVGVTSVTAGAGATVAPNTGDVTITNTASGGALPYLIDSFVSFGLSAVPGPAFITVDQYWSPTAPALEMQSGPYFRGIANGSVYTFLLMNGLFQIQGDTTNMRIRLRLDFGSGNRILAYGTVTWSPEGGATYASPPSDYVNLPVNLYTTVNLNAGDIVTFEISGPNITAFHSNIGMEVIRWR